MEKNKHYFSLIGLIVLVLGVFSVSYYFLYSLPQYNNQKLKLEQEKQTADIKIAQDKAANEQQKQDEEKNTKMLELAKNIQDDCIKSTQSSVVYYFDNSSVTANPLYYPYENEASFNKNERLITAIEAYRTCLGNDPRNDGTNTAIKSILSDAETAYRLINNDMVSYRDKTEGLCDSYLLTESAKSKCADLTTIKYNFNTGI